MNSKIQILILTLASLLGASIQLPAQGTAFTYQGRLNDVTNPASGIYDLRFTLYDALTGGNAIAGLLTNSATGISNGLFTVVLDFGAGVFAGADRWLEIGVRTNGIGGFIPLSARQKFTAAPYAISAGNLSGVLRVELNTNGAPNLIGGSPRNQVDAGVIGATISGGGALDYFGFPYTNRVSADFGAIGGGIANLVHSYGSVIGGGSANTAEIGASYSVIAGGVLNRIQTGAFGSFIAGGGFNVIQNGVAYASIGGGQYNTNASSYSVIAGGQNNTTEPFTDSSAIGGGWLNYIQSGADQSVIAGGNAGHILQGARESFIGGGFANTIQTNAQNAFIGGGSGNVIGTNAILSTIGGGENNSIYPNGQYAFIGGGRFNSAAYLSTVSGGQGNVISNASFGTIGGGVANGIAYAVQYGTIGGGTRNQISQFAHGSTISGGWSNSILLNVQISSIGGGFGNTIRFGGDYSSIGGGLVNTNGGYISVVAGGENNTISPLADRSVISGGGNNRIIGSQLLPVYATISGGQGNSVQTNSSYSTIPGGLSNSVAGVSSFAAGNRAKALHNGTFVWADSQNADFSSTTSNQFSIRAGGGVQLDNLTSQFFGSQTRQMLNLFSTQYGIGVQAGALYFRTGAGSGGFNWFVGGIHSDFSGDPGSGGVQAMSLSSSGLGVGVTPQQRLSVAEGMNLDQNNANFGTVANALTFGSSSGEAIASKRTAGGNQFGLDFYTASSNRMVILNTGNVGIGTNSPQQKLHVNGNILASGTITGSSDRNVKEHFSSVNPRDVLEKVSALPITEWNYKADNETLRHIGPMAQDFYSAFNVGLDDKHISMVDADGVALAAIQGLNQKLEARSQKLEAENAELKQRLEALEKIIRNQKSN